MWLFGKKKEAEAPKKEAEKPVVNEDPQIQAFAQQFDPEEFVILAVTGPTGFTGTRPDEDHLWMAGIKLTAWMREKGDEVYREEMDLITLADERLLSYLRARVPRDFIIKARVRKGKDKPLFQLIGLPEPGFDIDLKLILEEQKKPVTMENEDFGTFTYMRSSNLFDTETQWNGLPLRLNFEKGDDAQASLAVAKELFADQSGWDEKLRSFAAERFLDSAREWLEETESVEAPEDFTREQFMAALEPDSLQVRSSGEFDFWFSGGELLWGHFIHITGTPKYGLADGEAE